VPRPLGRIGNALIPRDPSRCEVFDPCCRKLNLFRPSGTNDDMAEFQPDSGPNAPASVDLPGMIGTHGDRLLRSAYLLCGNETEAQDLVQETFLQALKSATRFRGESSAYTWLQGILRNLCHHHFRKQKRLVFEEELVLMEPSPPGAAEASDEDFRAAKLAEAVQKLSPGHREVVVLRYYENMKIHEIASHTGVSVGTVKSRLHYAVRCLERLVPGELNVFAAEGTHNQATP
jgi:RNA polymerase sigma-70 factor (ECF subfamily)